MSCSPGYPNDGRKTGGELRQGPLAQLPNAARSERERARSDVRARASGTPAVSRPAPPPGCRGTPHSGGPSTANPASARVRPGPAGGRRSADRIPASVAPTRRQRSTARPYATAAAVAVHVSARSTASRDRSCVRGRRRCSASCGGRAVGWTGACGTVVETGLFHLDGRSPRHLAGTVTRNPVYGPGDGHRFVASVGEPVDGRSVADRGRTGLEESVTAMPLGGRTARGTACPVSRAGVLPLGCGCRLLRLPSSPRRLFPAGCRAAPPGGGSGPGSLV